MELPFDTRAHSGSTSQTRIIFYQRFTPLVPIVIGTARGLRSRTLARYFVRDKVVTMWTIVGLGNPGEEYRNTRHNAGRIALQFFINEFDFDVPVFTKKYQALFSSGKLGKQEVVVLLPETFMNKSGVSVASVVKSKKKAEQLIVVHDDLDLPLGKIKISWNRGTGGHRGVLSIVKNLKTEEFIRIRIGVSPTTPSGKLKKPKGEDAVDRFVVGEFKASEFAEIKKVSKKVTGALEAIILYGVQSAMGEYNGN